MKKCIVFFAFVALLCGCASTPLRPKYAVFPVNNTLEPVTSPAAGLRLRMAEDLRAYSAPLCFQTDHTVRLCREVQYYAPLEVALARALEDITVFKAECPDKIKIEVRDYCVVVHDPATLQTPPGAVPSPLEVRVNLLVTRPGQPAAHHGVSHFLPAACTPQDLHAAFAQALYEAYKSAF